MPFAVIDGHRIHYQVTGPKDTTDAPPVVLIHGLLNGMHVWRMLAPMLAREFRVITVDLLGHGESEKPRRPDLRIANQGCMIIGLLDALGIERAALVGHSMGGQTALWIGSHHPERVSRLAALTAVTEARLTPLSFLNCGLIVVGASIPPVGRTLTALFRLRGNPLRPLFIERALYFRRQPDSVFYEIFDEQLRPDNYPCKISGIRAVFGYHALPDAHRLTMPVLIVAADRDRVVPIRQSQRLKARLPHAQMVTFQNCGHMLQYDMPDELGAELLGFLRG